MKINNETQRKSIAKSINGGNGENGIGVSKRK
jgi:hypothetical protein